MPTHYHVRDERCTRSNQRIDAQNNALIRVGIDCHVLGLAEAENRRGDQEHLGAHRVSHDGRDLRVLAQAEHQLGEGGDQGAGQKEVATNDQAYNINIDTRSVSIEWGQSCGRVARRTSKRGRSSLGRSGHGRRIGIGALRRVRAVSKDLGSATRWCRGGLGGISRLGVL